ncbi:MAG: glycosyltransferase [candidate division KSB1 bacterium]|nr:glycosyltransferase [candidate division KSB1 bacterium]
MYKGLKSQGLHVRTCFPPDKRFIHYPKLLWRAWRLARGCDVVLVGFYGQLLLPFVKLITQKPILFDMYIATFDTMVHDRRAARDGSAQAKFYKWSDRLACKLSEKLVLETRDHIRDFSQKFRIPEGKFKRIFLAVDNTVIHPRPPGPKANPFLVHFHGEYAPFHGVNTILQAAALLKNENIHFQIVGKGITYKRDRQLARDLLLDHVTFYDPVPYHQLADFMARADVCLGIFGDNERMLRVTTNKVIEAIAMGKPLITGRNRPVQELLTHNKSAYLIPRANPRELANAIIYLKNHPDLCETLGKNAYRTAKQNCTLEIIGQDFGNLLQEIKHEPD